MFYPHYVLQREKIKNALDLSSRYEFLLNNNVQMFKHKFDTSEDIEISRFMIDSIEYKLNTYGCCAFFIFNKKLLFEPLFFGGERNEYGFPSDAYVTLQYKGTKIDFKNWIVNDKLVIVKNTKLATWDRDIERIAVMQHEIDKSYKCNVINSRLAPLMKVTSKKDKMIIDKVIDNIKEGNTQTVALTQNLINDDNLLEKINVTDVNDSSKIQYLDLAQESIFKRYYQENGVNLNSSVKKAQQSISEINDGANSAFIYPSNKLEARCSIINEMEEKFNIKYSCEFSECWKQQWEQIIMSYEDLQKGGDDNGEKNVDNNESNNNGENSSICGQPNDNNNE